VTVTTGVLTSVFTFLYCALYITMPGNFVYIAAFLVHSRMYANTLLASLNTRKVLRSLSSREDMSLQLLSRGNATGPLPSPRSEWSSEC
jgi:hypothetical protein